MKLLPRILATIVLATFMMISLHGQNSTIKGIVKDKVTEVPIIGASIMMIENNEMKNGAQSNEDGYFVIKDVEPGRHMIVVEYLGYEKLTIPNILVTSGKESEIEILMEESTQKLAEVVVSAAADKDKSINEMVAISGRNFSLEEVTRYSGGRNDASRLVSNFAGVATGNDSRNDIVVRGNSPAGILWRLEGIPIPNPNHFSTLGTTGGPVSALNTNLLKNSDFITSAFPSEYGNATSGVFDVGFRSGNKDKTEFTAQLAAFSGLEAMVEGPISRKNNSSYLLSYRYSFVQLADAVGLEFGTAALPKYQDLTYSIDLGKSKIGNFKLFGIVAKSNIEFIGRELGEEDFFADSDADSKVNSYVNIHGLKHTYMVNNNNYIRTVISFSRSGNDFNEIRYNDTTYTTSTNFTSVDDNTDRYNINTFYNTKFSAAMNGRVGVLIDHKVLNSNVITRDNHPDLDNDGQPDFLKIREIYGGFTTYEPYVSMKVKLNNKWSVIGGLHGMVQQYNSKAIVEPRFTSSYAITEKSSINFGYGLHAQSQPLPVLFLKTFDAENNFRQLNDDLDFTKAHHFVLGYDLKPWQSWRIKTEAYYQSLYDVPVEKKLTAFSLLNAGADFVFPQVGNLVNEGTGRNYGMELTVEKFFSNNYYGLLTTSVFQSKYKGSDKIERNTAFNNEYVMNLLAGKEWAINSKTMLTTDFKFTYAGGRFVTPVNIEASKLANREILFEDKPFSDKLSNYLRLDFKIGVRMNSKKYSQTFFFDFQNITNNKNIFTQRYNRNSQTITTVNQIGFFPDLLWRIQF